MTTHPDTPVAGHEHDGPRARLGALVGRWITEGTMVSDGTRIVSSDVFEWAPGARFVVHTAHGLIGDSGGGGVEVIGVDERGDFRADLYDSRGHVTTRTVTERDGLWTWSGGGTRCIALLSADGQVMTTHHERQLEDGHWEPRWTRPSRARPDRPPRLLHRSSIPRAGRRNSSLWRNRGCSVRHGGKAEEGDTWMDVALGAMLGLVFAASLWAAWRLVFARQRVLAPEGIAMQAAVHAATSLLPHLRRGLNDETARPAARALRTLTGAQAVALADGSALLAFEGAGSDHHHGGDSLAALVGEVHPDRVRVEPRMACAHPDCPLRSAIVAPLVVQEQRIGALIALYDRPGRMRLEESRVVAEASALVAAMIELSEVEAQGERLARAELRALRAQISPHFIYNALAAVAAYIHSRPTEARELLTEFAEFIRYAFAGERPYVTLADELRYVEKYLRLEQARFGERLRVRVQVDPDVLPVAVPVLSVQPLVENAVRHGVESRAEGGTVVIQGRNLGADVELRIVDDGAGIRPEVAAAALAGSGRGIGLANVQSRLVATFGDGYGLRISGGPGTGAVVVMTLPKFRAGVRAA